ncbi:MAG: hypothetical protein ACPG3V_02105 [Porticoccaceae bacterium]
MAGTTVGGYFSSLLVGVAVLLVILNHKKHDHYYFTKSIAFNYTLLVCALGALLWSLYSYQSFYIASTILALVFVTHVNLDPMVLRLARNTIYFSLMIFLIELMIFGDTHFIDKYGKNVSGTLAVYALLCVCVLQVQKPKSQNLFVWLILTGALTLYFGVHLDGRSQILMGTLIFVYMMYRSFPGNTSLKIFCLVLSICAVFYELYVFLDFSNIMETAAKEPRYLLYLDFIDNFYSILFGSGSNTYVFEVYKHNYHNGFLQFIYLGGIAGLLFVLLTTYLHFKFIFTLAANHFIVFVLILVLIRMVIDSVFIFGAESVLYYLLLMKLRANNWKVNDL